MTYTSQKQRDLRARLDAVRHHAFQQGVDGYFDRAIAMFSALIEGRDPATVNLSKVGVSGSTASDEQRFDRCTDRIWELAQDATHYDRIMAGLTRLSQL